MTTSDMPVKAGLAISRKDRLKNIVKETYVAIGAMSK